MNTCNEYSNVGIYANRLIVEIHRKEHAKLRELILAHKPIPKPRLSLFYVSIQLNAESTLLKHYFGFLRAISRSTLDTIEGILVSTFTCFGRMRKLRCNSILGKRQFMLNGVSVRYDNLCFNGNYISYWIQKNEYLKELYYFIVLHNIKNEYPYMIICIASNTAKS